MYISGEYSTDVKDHQKFNNLPEDFPSHSRYSNQFSILREDRNTCDYDHMSTAKDLVLGSRVTEDLVREFLEDVKKYLNDRGMRL